MIKLNRRITVRGWGVTQNEIGSPVADEVAAWQQWAQVEDRSGVQVNPYNQSLWQYDYKITVRHERTRTIGSNYTIDYDGKRLVVNSISHKSEAYRQYDVLRCTAIDDSTGTGSGGSVTPLPQIGVYDYTGVGGEDEFTASVLTGRYVFSATKDGAGFVILRETGTLSDEFKGVINTKATGKMQWSVPFEPGEKATILYL